MFSSDRSKRCCENHQPVRYDEADIECLKSEMQRMADKMQRMIDEMQRIVDEMQRDNKETRQMSTVDRRREDDSEAKHGRAGDQYFRSVEHSIGRNPVPPDDYAWARDLEVKWRDYARQSSDYWSGRSTKRPIPPL
jgi:hypothetical protein